MDLADRVYHYYKNNRHLLGDDKRFHFATRMVAWTGDEELKVDLKKMFSYIAPNADIKETLHEILHKPQTGQRNAHQLRQKYFIKYPKLYGAHLALFRVRHLKAVYDIDARHHLFELISKQELLQMRDEMLTDPEALKILSTFAINFIYLLNDMVEPEERNLPLEKIFKLKDLYDLEILQHIQLLIYLYTHCVIGDSGFYTRQVSTQNLPIYRQMLEVLEQIIETHYQDINLDNKFEFLVCARMVGFKPSITTKIYDEAKKSLSPDGDFIIDVHNNNIQADRMSYDKSEHRNVLFIMSASEYNPHSTLV